MNLELINYLKEGRRRGFSFQELKAHLVQNGFQPQNVDESINNLINPSNRPKPLPKNQIQPTQNNSQIQIKKRKPFLVLLFTIFTFGIYAIFWVAKTTNELKQVSKNAPNPWLMLLFIVPLVNIIVALIYFYKYSKAVNELTGFSLVGLYLLWIFLLPIAMLVTQKELNKKATN